MESNTVLNSYSVGVLVVSDSVYAGEKKDSSGVSVANFLRSEQCFRVLSVEEDCVADDSAGIENILKRWSDEKRIDLILTVGGTGFSPRDVTPEATKAVIDREAPHLASRMIQSCYEKSKFSVLSRSACGMRGRTLILNLPGSVKGSLECFQAIGFLIPHALDQLKGEAESVAAFHKTIQATN